MTSLLNDGAVDIVWSGLSITPERQKEIAFTQSYWNEPVGLAVRKNTDLTISDLYSGKYAIGIQKGCSSDLRLAEYIGTDPYKKLQEADKIKNSYATFADSMQALSAGEVDFVVFDTSGIKDYIKTDSSLEYLGNIDEIGEEYAAAVKTGNTVLLAKLDAGIAALKKSGDLQYIQIKYGFAKAVAHTH
jgi:ABC-type amino acid transport/signal transduction systems, periplasmic component/domain